MENLLLKISIMLVPALLAITVHEVSHGWMADRCGDPTARLLGRLTLNPRHHLDPLGTILLLVVGFGWAKPVPVNFANLDHPRRDMIWVSLAGPVSNFALAIACGLLLRLVMLGGGGTGVVAAFVEPVALMAAFGLYINIILGLLNLIPVPPLDGGRVLTGLLPPRQAEAFARVEPFGMIIVLLLLFFTDFWKLLVLPVVELLAGLLAGPQIDVVHRVVKFLLGS
jgi:Zn-dependent protease